MIESCLSCEYPLVVPLQVRCWCPDWDPAPHLNDQPPILSVKPETAVARLATRLLGALAVALPCASARRPRGLHPLTEGMVRI
jgi:hypothetical protein